MYAIVQYHCKKDWTHFKPSKHCDTYSAVEPISLSSTLSSAAPPEGLDSTRAAGTF